MELKTFPLTTLRKKECETRPQTLYLPKIIYFKRKRKILTKKRKRRRQIASNIRDISTLIKFLTFWYTLLGVYQDPVFQELQRLS